MDCDDTDGQHFVRIAEIRAFVVACSVCITGVAFVEPRAYLITKWFSVLWIE